VLAQESLHTSQLRHTNQYEMKMQSHLHFTPLVIKLSGFKRSLAFTISFAMGANYRSGQKRKIRLLASFGRVFVQFFQKPQQCQPFIF
jgi:hypothetical protein